MYQRNDRDLEARIDSQGDPGTINGMSQIGPREVMAERMRRWQREEELALRGIETPPEEAVSNEPVWKTAQKMGIEMPRPASTTPDQPPSDDTSDLYHYDDL